MTSVAGEPQVFSPERGNSDTITSGGKNFKTRNSGNKLNWMSVLREHAAGPLRLATCLLSRDTVD